MKERPIYMVGNLKIWYGKYIALLVFADQNNGVSNTQWGVYFYLNECGRQYT